MSTQTRIRLPGGLTSMGLVLPVLVLGCSGELVPEDVPPGALRGELTSYVATRDDGTSDEYYTLRHGDEELRLVLDGDPDLGSGAQVDVWGTRAGGALHVRRLEVVRPPVEPIVQPLRGATPYPARSIVMAIVRIATPPAMPLNPDVARQKLFGTTATTQPSVRQYYVEASYGRQDIAGEVVGPFEFPMMGNCMTSALATALRPMIPGTYNHYLWYMEPRNASCGFSGLASSGTPTRPARDTWYNGSTGCVVLMQEPGHNFGMRHSSFMKCPGAAFADEPNGVCTHNEYGDRYDPMGGACRHMNAYQKTYQGWLDKCNMVDIGSSGTFTVLPLELPCDGIQALSIKMPKARAFAHSGGGGAAATDMINRYYVEMRAPIGIDKGLTPAVQIRVGGDISERNRRGLHTWFLDMDPATTTQDGLAVGATFSDPSGSPKITLVALDATKATVKVEFEGGGTGGATCIDGTPFEGSGSGPESCAAVPASPGGVPPTIPDGGSMPQPQPTPGDAGAAMRLDARAMAAPDAAAPVTTPPTPDAATPKPAPAADSGTVTGPVGMGEDAGGSTETKSVSGGCGCEVGSAPRPAPLVVVLVGLALLRRRRR
jgi:MYXO-CTERM domain-containing protein